MELCILCRVTGLQFQDRLVQLSQNGQNIKGSGVYPEIFLEYLGPNTAKIKKTQYVISGSMGQPKS